MKSISFQNYNVQFVDDANAISKWLKTQSYTQIFILVDENTKRDCLPKLDFNREIIPIEIPSGEQNKTITTCQKIWNVLLAENADRQSILLNLGGGVIGDMGGFCASTFKRGIDFVNIPTTLLAMVDATVGGKTGIDFQGQKNMIGLFSFPKAVFVHLPFLQTLEKRQYLSGMAEMYKHGLITDENHWDEVGTLEVSKEQIIHSIKIKKQVVLADTYERGERKKLNFGHTIGHAFESFSLQNHKEPLLHGEAVTLGMIAELYLSHILLDFPKNKLKEIQIKLKKHLEQSNVQFDFFEKDIESIVDFALNDKKNYGGKIMMSLLKDIGNCVIDLEVSVADLKKAIKSL